MRLEYLPRRATAGLFATGMVALAALGVASSHREAPFVTENPKVDATDFYMFRSYEPGREEYVTLVANYLPLQDPYGGPNYFTMDPEARYEIRIDHDGDAVEDLTFRFFFKNRLKPIQLPVGPPGQEVMVDIPLRYAGPVSSPNSPTLNENERFWCSVVTTQGSSQTSAPILDAQTGSQVFLKPLDNVGTKTIPDYATYADQFVYDILLPDGSQGRMFVGQRKDPFVVNLGEVFDLVNLNPVGPPNARPDELADKNVTSLILEVPRSFLASAGQSTIGGWTTARLPRSRTLLDAPTYALPALEPGQQDSDFVQVSRLGMPLVNEVVIGLTDKNLFNASRPVDDAQFFEYVTNPTLPELLEILFGVQAPDFFPRADLVAVFATGISGLNDTGGVGEMLRLDTNSPITPAASQDRLGVLAGDLGGFPNGRRPGDDVVDISLRVVMGALLSPDVAPAGQLPYTDGALVDSSFFDASFPYLRDPLPGSPSTSCP